MKSFFCLLVLLLSPASWALSYFNAINISGHFNVRLILIGQTQTTSVMGSKCARRSVRRDVLSIRQCCSLRKALSLVIYTRQINNITVRGSSVVTLAGLHNNKFYTTLSGGARLTVSGSVNQLAARLSSHSQLDAKNLRARIIMVQARDRAIAKVLPVETLLAFASNSSNIYYYSWPKYLARHSTQCANILQAGWKIVAR